MTIFKPLEPPPDNGNAIRLPAPPVVQGPTTPKGDSSGATKLPVKPTSPAAPGNAGSIFANGPQNDADWQKFYQDSANYYNLYTNNGLNKNAWTADVYSKFAQQYGIDDAVARKAFQDFNTQTWGNQTDWQKNYGAEININKNTDTFQPTGGWDKFYNDSKNYYNQVTGNGANKAAWTSDVYSKFAHGYGIPANVSAQAFKNVVPDSSGELPWQSGYQKYATSPQVTAGRVAETPSYQINPMVWDSMGQNAQDLVKSAVGDMGGDWNTWLTQLNASRPVGTAPKNGVLTDFGIGSGVY